MQLRGDGFEPFEDGIASFPRGIVARPATSDALFRLQNALDLPLRLASRCANELLGILIVDEVAEEQQRGEVDFTASHVLEEHGDPAHETRRRRPPPCL